MSITSLMQTYRDILNSMFRDRNLANPSYSLRAFARDLGLAPSTLSEVLNGRGGISVRRSDQIAQRLRLPEWQRQAFCDLAAREHAKSPRQRREAAERLAANRRENELHSINDSAMRALTSWVDLAILELTNMRNFEPRASWIARQLGVDEALIRASVDRLKTAKLLRIEGEKWIDASPFFTSSDGISSEAVRLFQKTVLQKALKKLESRDLESRTVKSVVFSISNDNVPRARKILDEAIGRIAALADERQEPRENVMCFSSQLFSLIEGESK